jgi:hypothetical protein
MAIPPAKMDSGFDPKRGCQEPHVGLLGGLYLVVLLLAFAGFRLHLKAEGYKEDPVRSGARAAASQPDLTEKATPWERLARSYREATFFPRTSGSMPRSYTAGIGVLLLVFLFMATWDRLRHPLLRGWTLATALGGASLCGGVASGLTLGFEKPYFEGPGGGSWTRFEAALLFQGLCYLGPWLLAGLKALERRDPHAPPLPWAWAFRTGFWRWLGALGFFTLALLLYRNHPLYADSRMLNWEYTVHGLYLAYLVLGLPYTVLTNAFRRGQDNDCRDPGFVFWLLVRGIRRGTLGRLWRNHATGSALRDLLVKAFFLPLMVQFFFSQMGGLTAACVGWAHWQGMPGLENFHSPYLLEGQKDWAISHAGLVGIHHACAVLLPLLFVMDTGLGALGYACSSRWLDNKSRSVEPTLFGWAVALACYPPFNSITGTYLPLHGESQGGLLNFYWAREYLSEGLCFGMALALDLALKAFIILNYLVYVWATTAFGLRFSNLTHRGIITRGPYAYVRHPAYIAKNLAWWAEYIRTFPSFALLLCLLVQNYIYYLRAVTEEEHLQQDPNYRAYQEQVKYKFIPGWW